MARMLIAWDAGGTIVATLDALVRDGQLVELQPGDMTVPGAAGSDVWPEALPDVAARYRVEVGADGRAVALIARANGKRRARPGAE